MKHFGDLPEDQQQALEQAWNKLDTILCDTEMGMGSTVYCYDSHSGRIMMDMESTVARLKVLLLELVLHNNTSTAQGEAKSLSDQEQLEFYLQYK